MSLVDKDGRESGAPVGGDAPAPPPAGDASIAASPAGGVAPAAGRRPVAAVRGGRAGAVAAPEPAPFASVEDAVEDIRVGRMVIVVDDEDRENEGDLVMAAERATPEAVNFMTRYGRGLICVPVTGERLDALRVPQMVPQPGDHMGTAFSVSVDARTSTTGISAYERCATVRVFVDPAAGPEDLVRPGHIFPLRAKSGGVLRRPGHTEAAVDLAVMGGLQAAGVICEILAEDGHMMRLPELRLFARDHGLRLLSIADLVAYRKRNERLVARAGESLLPTRTGEWRLIAYEGTIDGETHVALVFGEVADGRPVLVRMHSECLVGDVFGAQRCQCGAILRQAMAQIAEEGRGVVVYLRQGAADRAAARARSAAAHQPAVRSGLALSPSEDPRDYGTGAQILADLGVRRLRLLTNHQRHYHALAGFGLEVVDRVPVRVPADAERPGILLRPRTELGHLFD